MTISSGVSSENKGILSFFQNNIKSKKDMKNSAPQIQDNLENGLEIQDDTNNTVIEDDPVEILLQENSDDGGSRPGEEMSDKTVQPTINPINIQDQDENKSLRHRRRNPSAASEQENNNEETAQTKREELRRQRELKKHQKEEEKRQKEAKRHEEKRQRELQKDAEKKKREELKKQKQEERLKAKKQKELEKRQKEDERRQKEEEKLKKEEEKKLKEINKERSQLRIGKFFKKVNDSVKQADVKSDFEKYFLPFYAKDGTILPENWPSATYDLDKSKSSLDSTLKETGAHKEENLDAFGWLNSKRQNRGYKIKFTATGLLQQMTSKEKEESELLRMLALIPQKYIKFYENVRPPYIGTYSKDIILPVENPFSTDETGYNYEYDSDLEWVNEEDEDGEGAGIDNLESDEEDEEDEEEDEASEGEFDGFLEVEDRSLDGLQGKKKMFLGPLIPTVCLRNEIEILDDSDKTYFGEVRVTYLSEHIPFPIEPLIPIVKQQNTVGTKRFLPDERNDINSESSSPSVSPQKKKPKALISDPKSLLKLFDEVEGSTFSLGTVTEIAQKNLPQYSKQLIKNTVKEYAVRETGASRKWRIKDQSYWDELRAGQTSL